MSRKDYVAIAKAVKDTVGGLRDNTHDRNIRTHIKMVVTGIADVMQRDNAAFQRGKFLSACGLD